MYLRPLTPQPHHSVSKHSGVETSQSLLGIHRPLYVCYIYLSLFLYIYFTKTHDQLTLYNVISHWSMLASSISILTSAPQMF